MKQINSVDELKIAASSCDVYDLLLSYEMVEFLRSIGGKNRKIKTTNVEYWENKIKGGNWWFDNAEMKVNKSLTWLIDGHHRIEAVSNLKAYGLRVQMKVVLDENAEITFNNQDVCGSPRKLAEVLTLQGIANAALIGSVDRYYRTYVFSDLSKSTTEGVTDFAKRNIGLFEDINYRARIGPRPASAVIISAIVRFLEVYPNKRNDVIAAWSRIRSGEMLSSKSPEFHYRNFIIGTSYSRSNCKEAFLKTLKTLSMATDGQQIGVLKIGPGEDATLSKEFGLTSRKNKKSNKGTK